MRKMLVAMAKDLRVLIIKLSDRLHNMRTIAAMPAWKQERTARETIDIYAPLAHRLGMQEVRQELEDLSFAALHPKRYAEIDHMVSIRSPERDLYLAQVLEQVRDRLAELRINAEVTGRPKHLYSIYEKMVVKGREFDDIFDLVGIRVIVDSVKDCYAALGSIHATWKPVQGRFKDYVAMPKFNLYQSLHTTVVGPQGKPLEVQIRTYEMHARAEQGVAAHWQYKDGAAGPSADIAWLNRIVDWQSETSDPDEFMKQPEDRPRAGRGLRLHAQGQGRHPRGRRHARSTSPTPSTPRSATPASAPGSTAASCRSTRSCRRATRSRSSRRRSRAPVRRATGCTSSPPRGPPSKIRQWFSRERREDAVENGREELVKAMRREGLPVQKLANGPVLPEIAKELNYVDLDALYAAIGENHVSGKAIAARVAKKVRERRPRQRGGRDPPHHGAASRGAPARASARRPACTSRASTTSWSACPAAARPCPATRSSASSPVAAACRSTGPTAPTPCRWPTARATGSSTSTGTSPTRAPSWRPSRSRPSTAAASSATWPPSMSDHHVNILSSTTHTGSDRVSKMRFEFELADPGHLDSLLATLRGIDSVYEAYRVVPGQGG